MMIVNQIRGSKHKPQNIYIYIYMKKLTNVEKKYLINIMKKKQPKRKNQC